MLFTVGFEERRLRAVAWAAIVVANAFVADFLGRLDWEPFHATPWLRGRSPWLEDLAGSRFQRGRDHE
jgi:hypothetical protein